MNRQFFQRLIIVSLAFGFCIALSEDSSAMRRNNQNNDYGLNQDQVDKKFGVLRSNGHNLKDLKEDRSQPSVPTQDQINKQRQEAIRKRHENNK